MMMRECLTSLLILSEDQTIWIVSSAGGVKLVSGSRRITLDNTLDERLRLLEDRVSCHRLFFMSHPACILKQRFSRCFLKSARISLA